MAPLASNLALRRAWRGSSDANLYASCAPHAGRTPCIVELRGGSSDARSLDDPLATVTAGGHHHGLAAPPFVSSDYGQGGAHALDTALPTVTGKDKHSLTER